MRLIIIIFVIFIMMILGYGFRKPALLTLRAGRLLTNAISSPAPTTFDYQESSRRSANYFLDKNSIDASQVNITTVTCVPRSQYESFKSSALNPYTVKLLESLGTKLDKFPGNKLIFIPGSMTPETADRTFMFYDDKLPVSKLGLDSIVGSLKANKTYEFHLLSISNSPNQHAELPAELATKLCLTFALRSYRFNYLRSRPPSPDTIPATLIWPSTADKKSVLAMARAYSLYKDLVDSPALTLGPAQLAATAVSIAQEFSSLATEHAGVDTLIANNFPQVAAVGMASSSDRAPRVVDFTWAPSNTSIDPSSLPLVVIVGKGVCFDTGGLNIKGAGMRQMKKDMAGAAQALALALLLMDSNTPIRLRCLLPCVENSISGSALRPGDVIRARNNLTTEITNTDAEGRLVLADCLVAACEGEKPALLVDFATLTGAARVALGSELPALFCNKQTELMAISAMSQSDDIKDPMWPMPLWDSYKTALKSSVADLVNAGEGAGAITAALYLQEFVGGRKDTSASAAVTEDGDDVSTTASTAPLWLHIDFMGTKGASAEPQGLRAVFEYIKKSIAKT